MLTVCPTALPRYTVTCKCSGPTKRTNRGGGNWGPAAGGGSVSKKFGVTGGCGARRLLSSPAGGRGISVDGSTEVAPGFDGPGPLVDGKSGAGGGRFGGATGGTTLIDGCSVLAGAG